MSSSTGKMIKTTLLTRRFLRYSKVYQRYGTKLLVSPKGQAFATGFGILGTGVGMYYAVKGDFSGLQLVDTLHTFIQDHKRLLDIVETYEKMIVEHKAQIQQLQALIKQQQDLMEHYKSLNEELKNALGTQIQLSEAVIEELLQKIEQFSNNVSYLEDEIREMREEKSNGFWRYFTPAHWSSGSFTDSGELSGDETSNEENQELSNEEFEELLGKMPDAPKTPLPPLEETPVKVPR